MDDLKMGAIPAARLYHTQYRELPPPPGNIVKYAFCFWCNYGRNFSGINMVTKTKEKSWKKKTKQKKTKKKNNNKTTEKESNTIA